MQILIQWVSAVPDSGFLTFPGVDDVTSIWLYIYNMAATYFSRLAQHICMYVCNSFVPTGHSHAHIHTDAYKQK